MHMQYNGSMENLLTAEKAAQQLRVSPDTIRRLIRDGKLQATKIEGQWRIQPDDLRTVSLPRSGSLLDTQVITLIDHEIEGSKIPAGTIGYVAVHSRGVGGIYRDTITIRESPTWQMDRASAFPDLVLGLERQNETWEFVSNDGNSQSIPVPRVLLRHIKKQANDAYISCKEEETRSALESVYMAVRTMLGEEDRSDDDAIPTAIDRRNRALFGQSTSKS